MRLQTVLLTSCLLFLVAAAPATQPTLGSKVPLEIRATAAFNEGQYATALPLLKQLAASQSDKQKLGSLNEQIRVCQKNISAGTASPATVFAPPAIPTAPETRKPHAAPKPGDIAEMTIKELGNFDFDQEKGGNIPADVKGLNGSRIRLRGYMIPMDQAENITEFALVPSLFACCFGQPPQIQHTIVVNCPKGKAVGYCPDEIVVEGTLKVEEKRDDGYIVSIFGMDVSSVRPAPK